MITLMSAAIEVRTTACHVDTFRVPETIITRRRPASQSHRLAAFRERHSMIMSECWPSLAVRCDLNAFLQKLTAWTGPVAYIDVTYLINQIWFGPRWPLPGSSGNGHMASGHIYTCGPTSDGDRLWLRGTHA